ncbi:hypothetical protein DV702_05545 [Sporosarcina sp. PTS2304]|uniref:hypothetical protein n=1 Tax=Sporosarcina sp. PTS2304 TaxID=2283194 RepID=UPI000E0E07B6|nr:hypothetical protein [Sporosarcina sp. PTS2304]AXH99250.1 hypothetical protein DV702_05545 [Sporosarcina sp. PTS2304]
MYKKLFLFIVVAAVLAGCTANKNTVANTPEEALELLHVEEGYAEVVKVYKIQEVNKDRVITVYKGLFDDKEEYFVANVENTDDSWVVTDAIGLGVPSAETVDEMTETATFEAGYVRRNSASNPNTKLVEIGDSKYRAWIKEK